MLQSLNGPARTRLPRFLKIWCSTLLLVWEVTTAPVHAAEEYLLTPGDVIRISVF
jgi:protein involved in polysaccharide export with SLBB domain